MESFKPLSLEYKDIFLKYINPYTFSTCEFSFINLYIWRKAFDISFCIYDDALIIRKKDFDGSYFFLQPLGYKYDNIEKILNEMKHIKKNYPGDWLIKYAEKSFVKDLNELFPGKYIIKEDRSSFDYIYETKKLVTLSGNSLCKKRNNYNHFIKNNSYRVEKFKSTLIDDCIFIAQDWFNKCSEIPYLHYEIEAVKELLENYSNLNIQCLVVYVDNKPCAFSIGEKLNENMAVIHIEKADRNIRGLYAFINKCFIETFYSDTAFINREEDLGIESLRNVKMSYRPCRLEPKYFIK